MSGLKFTSDPSPSVPDKSLQSPDVGPALAGGSATYEGEQVLSGVKFGFGAAANASIVAFNSLDDKDEDGILGRPVGEGDSFEVPAPPQIELTEADAWLKYRCSALLKVSLGGAVAAAESKLDGSKEVVFTDYHRHGRTENARAAVMADLVALRFAGSPNDVLSLGEKEAVSYQVRGELSAAVTVSWSDVITASIGSLGTVLKAGKLLGVQVSPAASVTFHVGLVDDFRVVFSNPGNRRTRIAVKKSDSREAGVGLSLAVTVKWADETVAKEALTNLYQSIAGNSVSVVDQALAKATLEDLTDRERKVVDKLIKRLGLEELVQTPAELKERWETLKKSVADRIDQVAKAKIAVGFTYDYLRMRSEDSLLVVDVDAKTLQRFHNDLMLCEFRPLLAWVRETPAALVSYLNQTKLTRSKAWGFSLGIGPWSVGGKDKVDLTSVVQRNINGDERIAYRGLRCYTGKWLGDKVEWNVDFKAEMHGFAPKGKAKAAEFDSGLHFKWIWDQKKLTKSELLSYLDCAVIWRIIAQDNVRGIQEALDKQLNTKAQVSLELTIENDALRRLLPFASAASSGDAVARALAKAMPYIEMYEGRRLPKFRELLYAPLWKFYLQNDSLPIGAFPPTAAAMVQKVAQQEHIPDGEGLAARERGLSSTTPAYGDLFTFSGQIAYNGRISSDYSGVHLGWLAFSEGLNALNEALKPGSSMPHSVLEGVFKQMSKFWNQSLFVRAAGVYLTDVAAENGEILGGINRALTITPADGDVQTFVSSM